LFETFAAELILTKVVKIKARSKTRLPPQLKMVHERTCLGDAHTRVLRTRKQSMAVKLAAIMFMLRVPALAANLRFITIVQPIRILKIGCESLSLTAAPHNM